MYGSLHVFAVILPHCHLLLITYILLKCDVWGGTKSHTMTKVRLPDVPIFTLGRLNGTARYLRIVIYLILPHCHLLLLITYILLKCDVWGGTKSHTMTKVWLPDVPMFTLGRLNGTARYLRIVIYLILPHCHLLLLITYILLKRYVWGGTKSHTMTKVRLPDVPMFTLGRLNGTTLYLRIVIYLILPHCHLLLLITYILLKCDVWGGTKSHTMTKVGLPDVPIFTLGRLNGKALQSNFDGSNSSGPSVRVRPIDGFERYLVWQFSRESTCTLCLPWTPGFYRSKLQSACDSCHLCQFIHLHARVKIISHTCLQLCICGK